MRRSSSPAFSTSSAAMRESSSRPRKHSSAMFSAASTASLVDSPIGTAVERRVHRPVDVAGELVDVGRIERAAHRIAQPLDVHHHHVVRWGLLAERRLVVHGIGGVHRHVTSAARRAGRACRPRACAPGRVPRAASAARWPRLAASASCACRASTSLPSRSFVGAQLGRLGAALLDERRSAGGSSRRDARRPRDRRRWRCGVLMVRTPRTARRAVPAW